MFTSSGSSAPKKMKAAVVHGNFRFFFPSAQLHACFRRVKLTHLVRLTRLLRQTTRPPVSTGQVCPVQELGYQPVSSRRTERVVGRACGLDYDAGRRRHAPRRRSAFWPVIARLAAQA